MAERIEKLREFLKSSPDDPFLQHALALEYVKMGDDRSAAGVFETLLSKNPGYVGSYYHLGKLLERIGEPQSAIGVYETGMKQAKQAADQHSYNELQAAYEDLVD